MGVAIHSGSNNFVGTVATTRVGGTRSSFVFSSVSSLLHFSSFFLCLFSFYRSVLGWVHFWSFVAGSGDGTVNHCCKRGLQRIAAAAKVPVRPSAMNSNQVQIRALILLDVGQLLEQDNN